MARYRVTVTVARVVDEAEYIDQDVATVTVEGEHARQLVNAAAGAADRALAAHPLTGERDG